MKAVVEPSCKYSVPDEGHPEMSSLTDKVEPNEKSGRVGELEVGV